MGHGEGARAQGKWTRPRLKPVPRELPAEQYSQPETMGKSSEARKEKEGQIREGDVTERG